MKVSVLKANKAILALAILILPFASVKSQDGLQFEEKTWNFGERYLGEEFEHQFKFKNNNNYSVSIKDIFSSTKALSVDYSKLPIGPGETGYINLKCKFIDCPLGHVRRTTNILTSDDHIIRISVEVDLKYTEPPRLIKKTQLGDFYQIRQNDKYGIEDNNGNIILKTEYDNIIWLSDLGRVRVRKDKKEGVYDLKGKSILPVIYDYTRSNYEVLISGKDGYECVYDINGKSIIPLERKYTEITIKEDNIMGTYYCFHQGKRFGLCDRNGKEVWSHDFEKSSDYTKEKANGESPRTFIPVYRKGRFCLIVWFGHSIFNHIMDGKGEVVAEEREEKMLGCCNFCIKEDGMIVGNYVLKEGEVNIGYIDSFVETTDNPLKGNNH